MRSFYGLVELKIAPPLVRGAKRYYVESDLERAIRVYGQATVITWLNRGITVAEILSAAKSQGAKVE